MPVNPNMDELPEPMPKQILQDVDFHRRAYRDETKQHNLAKTSPNFQNQTQRVSAGYLKAVWLDF